MKHSRAISSLMFSIGIYESNARNRGNGDSERAKEARAAAELRESVRVLTEDGLKTGGNDERKTG